MELLETIRHELDLYVAGYLSREDYDALVDELFRFVRGEGQQAYLRGLADGQKGGEKK